MNIAQISSIGSAIAFASSVQPLGWGGPCVAPADRTVPAGQESDSDPNRRLLGPVDFWAFLERENRRVGSGHADRQPPAPLTAGRSRPMADDRVISYGMPRIGQIPGQSRGGASASLVGGSRQAIAVTAAREVFTPIGTRIDVLA